MADPSEHDLALMDRAAELSQQQQELSGATAGLALRHLSEAQREERSPGAKSQRQRKHADLRQIMLASAAYQAAHRAFGERLAEAERFVTAAMDQAQIELESAREDLAAIRDHAARAPDGTRVYRDEDGVIRSEDGRAFDELEGVVIFPDGASSYEEFIAKHDQIETLHMRLQELQRIQVDVLGVARDRYKDHDFSSVEEMEAFEAGISDILEAPAIKVPNAVPTNDQQMPASNFELPTLNG